MVISTKSYIWVTFQKKGLHRYPAARFESNLKPVEYLANEHRHLFKFKVGIEVFHDNRDIEFHLFLNWLESLYNEKTIELDHKSCEMIADELAEKIQAEFPGRDLKVEVSEDGECGVDMFYLKKK